MKDFKYYFYGYASFCFFIVASLAIFTHSHYWHNYILSQKTSAILMNGFYFLIATSFFKMWLSERTIAKIASVNMEDIIKESVN